MEDIIFRGKKFRYSAKLMDSKGMTKTWHHLVFIECFPVTYQGMFKPGEKGFARRETCLLFIKNLLESKCVGTEAEKEMRKLPIFKDGYMEQLNFKEDEQD